MTSEGDSESIRFMRGMCPQTHAHVKKNAHENCEKPAILKAIMRFATETRLGMPAALEQEPNSLLRFVNPVLQQACGSHIPCLVAQRMHLAHVLRQGRIVVPEFSYHVERLNVFSIVIHDALKTRNLPDGADGCASQFPRSLSNGIRHGEKLVALIIEHQMIVPEMRARHVPVEVLRFKI